MIDATGPARLILNQGCDVERILPVDFVDAEIAVESEDSLQPRHFGENNDGSISQIHRGIPAF
jgi:hypothetical protein